jgi:DNA polymerase-3 subunit epsilon
LDQDASQRQRPEVDSLEAVATCQWPCSVVQAAGGHHTRELRETVTNLKYGTAAVLDIETTGLSPYRDEIVELAIMLFRYDPVKGQVLEVVSEYSGLREPSCPMRRNASAVHGITRRMVRGLRLDYRRIRTILQEADFVVAHNAAFDRSFVERLMPSSHDSSWLCSLNGIDWEARGFTSRCLEDLVLLC